MSPTFHLLTGVALYVSSLDGPKVHIRRYLSISWGKLCLSPVEGVLVLGSDFVESALIALPMLFVFYKNLHF